MGDYDLVIKKGALRMSTSTKWIIGIVIALILVLALPFIWHALFPSYGYGMMGYGRAPMMGGYGFMPFGMLFMWLLPIGLLILIALGIAALIKYLTSKPG